MKKILVLVLAFTLAFSPMTACSGTGVNDKVDESSSIDSNDENTQPIEETTLPETTPQTETTPVTTAPPPEITGTAFVADMTSTDAWKMMNKTGGAVGSFTSENNIYMLSEDEISIPVEIDLTKNPSFSITVESMDDPTLYVRLQVPGLSAQPGYNTGYIGFEALQYDGVNTFDINDELDLQGYFDSNEKGVVSCTLNIWAYQTTVTISDIRIEYYG